MYCPNCGEKLPEGARFCGACGSRLEKSFITDTGEVATTEEVNVLAVSGGTFW